MGLINNANHVKFMKVELFMEYVNNCFLMLKGVKYLRKIFFYLLYFILILVYIFGSYKLLNIIRLNAQAAYDMRPWAICSIISYFLFGLLLALDFIVKQIRNKGQWHVHVTKLLIIGFPSLICVVLSILQFYLPVTLPRLFHTQDLMMFIPILLGFVVGTSFYKEDLETLPSQDKSII